MTATPADEQCGARRPGWESGPPIGINRIPCVREHGHQNDHENAWGQRWARIPEDEHQDDPEPAKNPPTHAVTVALCIECRTLTRAPVAVRWIQGGSGPGTTLYACPDHAPSLTPGPIPGELEPDA